MTGSKSKEVLSSAALEGYKIKEWSIKMGFVVVAVFLVYANMLKADFVWDDNNLVVKNTYISDFSYAKEIFKSDLAAGAGQKYYFYRPLQNVSYAIEHAVFGLNPWGYHLVNILLHLAAVWAVFRLVLHLTNEGWFALFTATIFALHPVHSSVVCYIASRADLLCGLWMLWSFYWYIQSVELYDRRKLGFSVFFYVLALFSKEYALILPVFLCLFNSYRKISIQLRWWGVFIGVSLVYVVFRIAVVPDILSPFNYVVPLALKIPGAFAALAEYARLLIFPSRLHMAYGNFLFSFSDLLVWKGIFLFIVLGGAMVVLRRSLLGFACGWFLLGLIPVILFPVNAFMAESWLYVPSVGYVLVLAWLVRFLLTHLKLRIFGCLLAVVVILGYAQMTWQQTRYWQDDLVFFSWTAKHASHSGKVFYNLGNAYLRSGDRAQAVRSYQKALELNPDIIEARAALEKLSKP
jgi:tetratricopeptide (TPR) repeat protein